MEALRDASLSDGMKEERRATHNKKLSELKAAMVEIYNIISSLHENVEKGEVTHIQTLTYAYTYS